MLQYCLMDFSFSVRTLEYKISVAAEHYSLKVPTVVYFPLERIGCTFNRTTLSHSSINVNKVHAAEHLLHSSSVLQEFHLSG